MKHGTSAQGFTPQYITVLVVMNADYARTVIHQSNSKDKDMPKPKWKHSGSYKFKDGHKKQFEGLAISRRGDIDLPFAQ